MKDFTTPVGRIVQGNVWTGKGTNRDGQPLLYKKGAMAGQPRTEYFFAIAIRKDDPGLAAFEAIIKQQAHEYFPHLVAADGSCAYDQFSWKIKDGDCTKLDLQGRCNKDRDGFAGCKVFAFSGSNAPGIYERNSNNQVIPLQDESKLKRGYYVQVFGSTKGNDNSERPGMYLNHSMVMLVAPGEEIVNGPDAAAAFGAAPAPLPPGVSMTPAPVVPTQAAPQAPVHQPSGAPATTMAAPQPPVYQAPPAAQVTPQVPPVAVQPAAAPVNTAPTAAPAPYAANPVAAPAPVPGIPGVPPIPQG